MNKEELAELLNGRTYGDEMSEYQEAIAKDSGLLVVFGASDDLIELRGIINDEDGAWDGTTIAVKYIETQERFKMCKPNKSENKITAVWSPDEPECSWLIKTELPHATFDIMEDGELFCRGIVIDSKDLK